MRLGALSTWLKGEPRDWQGRLFHASAEGRGRDLVLLHGLAASPECWEEAASRLPRDVRIHQIHMRGFAGSKPAAERTPDDFLKPMADELAHYLRDHARTPVALAGHSMGGLVALILGRDHPDVVDRLMIADVPAFFSTLISPFATAGGMSHLADASRRRYLDRDAAALEDELRRATEKLVGDPDLRERVLRWNLDSDRATTADVMAEVMVTDLRNDLSRITAPVHVVYAWEKSGHMTRVGVDQLYASSYAGLRQKQMTRIDEARHYLMLDQPAAFYATMTEWLAEA